MTRIRRLPEAVVNKIAAGEVVERPASVVKELIENSIDADATVISVEVRRGGKSLIRIRDNGCGMARDDALLALERHSTSKITGADDLFTVRTMGFRGEALPSIAAVSRIELTTKEQGALGGTRVTVSGGRVEDVRETGAPDGTEIVVRDLFFNTPARRKFLRSDRVELSHIVSAVTWQALARPGIGFTLIADGEEVIEAAPTSDARGRVSSLFGPDIAREIIPVGGKDEAITLTGFIGKPGLTRGNRSAQHYFINRRPIRERMLNFAVTDAFGGLLPLRRYAVVFLFLEVGSGEVDVNVHPAKREVRFRNVYRVRDLVRETIADALGNADLSPGMGLAGLRGAVGESTAGYVTRMDRKTIERIPVESLTREPLPWEEREGVLAGPGKKAILAIGQIKNLYVVAETPEGLAIIDQHAAHERVLFERVMSLYRQRNAVIQPLLIPAVVNLPVSEFVLAHDYLDVFKALGIGVEDFGKNSLKIDSLPACLGSVDPERLIRDIVGELAEKGRSAAVEDEMAELVAKKVCRAAVKRRDSLKGEELQRLVDDLLSCENPYTCPHGRPTIVKISMEELDKKFGRA